VEWRKKITRALIVLGYSLLTVAIIAVLVFFIWLYPELQISPSKELTLKELIELRNETRRTNAQIVGGLVLLFGLYLTYRRITATERNVQVAQENVRVAQEGQITERFTRAIEQLGNPQLEIRLGGIYALERIAKDSADDHWTIMEVLTTFVREKAPRKEEKRKLEQNQSNKEKNIKKSSEPTKTPNDIQAILTVVGRREWTDTEKNNINLSKTNLIEADLSKANLSGADLSNANLTKARLIGANLQRANLIDANLSGANLREANLTKAWLIGANLSGADFDKANLSEAVIVGTNLTKANLSDANLSGADLSEANLTKANLYGANLSEANLIEANLKGAYLTRADLEGADLEGVNLEGAYLCGADLRETDLDSAVLDDAIYDKTTLFSDYINQEELDKRGMILTKENDGILENELNGSE